MIIIMGGAGVAGETPCAAVVKGTIWWVSFEPGRLWFGCSGLKLQQFMHS